MRRWPAMPAGMLGALATGLVLASAPLLAASACAQQQTQQPQPQQGQVLRGPVRVVDGDTLVIGGTRIRLYAVDAPESKQACTDPRGAEYSCGLAAKAALEAKIAGRDVSCAVNTVDQYGRAVAACGIPGADADLNAWLVSNGWAVAYRQYGGAQYGALEDGARAERRGVWAGGFTTPSEFRKAVKSGAGAPPTPRAPPPAAPASARATAAAVTAAAPAMAVAASPSGGLPPCGGVPPVLGNIGKGGIRLYHVPGGRSYDSVKIDLTAGERLFCSAAEAEAAGWRAAKY